MRAPQPSSRISPRTAALLVAGRNSVSETLNLSATALNLAPRIGLAYGVDSKTIVRSGFGLFYGSPYVEANQATPGFANPAAPFQPSDALSLGSLGRNTTRGPGLWNLDTSLFREFALAEAKNLQFRCEVFNVLNARVFRGWSSTDIASAPTGWSRAFDTGTAPCGRGSVSGLRKLNRAATKGSGSGGQRTGSNFGPVTGTILPRTFQLSARFNF